MSYSQADLFGGAEPIVWDVAPAVRWDQAADAKRRLYVTCWERCRYCSPQLLEQRNQNVARRVYRLCTHPTRTVEERCFADSVICERSDLFDDPASRPPATPESADF